jgi:hypothetical protein
MKLFYVQTFQLIVGVSKIQFVKVTSVIVTVVPGLIIRINYVPSMQLTSKSFFQEHLQTGQS